MESPSQPVEAASPVVALETLKAEPAQEISKYIKFATEVICRNTINKAPYNPRDINPKARARLTRNLEKRGLLQPLVVNRRTMNLVSGHQRLTILDALEGCDNYWLPVAMVDLSEMEEKEQNLFFNNAAAQGEFNLLMMEDLFKEGVSVEEAGFDYGQVVKLLGDDVIAEVEDGAAVAAEMSKAFDAFNTEAEKVKKQAEKSKDEQFHFYFVVVCKSFEARRLLLAKMGIKDDDFVDARDVENFIEKKKSP